MNTMANYAVLLLLCFLVSDTLTAGSVTRGPYLQMQSEKGITIHWRTDIATDSVIRYGDAPDKLVNSVKDPAVTTEHAVTVSTLKPAQQYWYSVGRSGATLKGGATFYFHTAPTPGVAADTRIWIIGDSGTADVNAQAVRDAYKTWSASNPADSSAVIALSMSFGGSPD